MSNEQKAELKKAVEILSEFVENVPGGESYWVDEEGKSHNADMGYVCEFLSDLEEYLNGTWVSKEDKICARYPAQYQVEVYLKNGDFKVFVCQSYIKNDDVFMIEINPFRSIKISVKDIQSLKCSSLKSGKDVYLYGP